MAPIFEDGEAILVTTHGPGNLHLYTYAASNGEGGVHGSVHTSRSGVSNFIIPYSYNYTQYAFYWDGDGKAECHIGWKSDPKTYPMEGKGWENSSWVMLGDTEVSVHDVS
ncbi:hypothetical protein JB92DRAFT_2785602, partial [Gautieria morchelliformis]